MTKEIKGHHHAAKAEHATHRTPEHPDTPVAEEAHKLMRPSVGRIVHYMLSASDAEEINGRRTNDVEIRDRMAAGAWSIGAQAHIGNAAEAGQVYPMTIVRVWDDTDTAVVNGQVALDGNDCYWATSRSQVATDADEQSKLGRWFAPPRI
jgi:hypothetical protein